MKLDAVRLFALALPESTEAPHFEMLSFRVGKKIFATVPPDGEHVHIFVDEERAHGVVVDRPAAFEILTWGKNFAGVRVRLAAAPATVVKALLEDAWRRRAPKTLVRAYDAEKTAN